LSLEMLAACLTSWWSSFGRPQRVSRRLVAALRIDREFADRRAVFGDHPIVGLRG